MISGIEEILEDQVTTHSSLPMISGIEEILEDQGTTHISLPVLRGEITLAHGAVLKLPKGAFTITKEEMANLIEFNRKDNYIEILEA